MVGDRRSCNAHHPSKAEPERFYHGFVLGLVVELSGRYVLTARGILGERIRRYGFALNGKEVFIGES
ncbi:MAG: hypothetical protein HFH82_15880 [Lachnospiraceae bacterium]|nr:hypothetical protein [Lachnospiraceae bacterium]